jgi:hypothetical protein
MKKQHTEKNLELSQAILDEKDYKKRWRMVHDLLRKTNPVAKKEQDKQQRALTKVREAGLYNSREKRRNAGLKFAVSIPNVTWQALVAADEASTGKLSILTHTDKKNTNKYKTKDATNQIARDLMEVFPEYRVS